MNPSKQIVTPKEFLFAVEEDDRLPLDCGRTLRNVTLKYETYGQLDEDKRNAILILHALSGDAHVCGYHSQSDDKPGKIRFKTAAAIKLQVKRSKTIFQPAEPVFFCTKVSTG